MESTSSNYNNYHWLLVTKHASYPKKCSLVKIQDIPSGCKTVNYASYIIMMYIYILHKPSWYRLVSKAPFISCTIQAHKVLQTLNETMTLIRCPTGYTTIHAYRPSGSVEIKVTCSARLESWKSKLWLGDMGYKINENTLSGDTRFVSRTDQTCFHIDKLQLNQLWLSCI